MDCEQWIANLQKHDIASAADWPGFGAQKNRALAELNDLLVAAQLDGRIAALWDIGPTPAGSWRLKSTRPALIAIFRTACVKHRNAGPVSNGE